MNWERFPDTPEGLAVAKQLSTRKEYGKTLVELGRKNKDIVVLDADLSGSTQTHLFAKEFKDRFFNMGIAEQDMMATAAGLAAAGKIPFASTFAIFATGRAWEQIRQSIAYSSMNVKIVASHGGVTVGDDGGSHQALEDIGLMRILPNMVVIVPADGVEMRKVIEAIAEYRGPVYVRGSRIVFPVIYDDDYTFTIGKGDLLRQGKDATIVAVGLMVHHALEAAELLDKEGISAEVINMACIKPLDRELILNSVRKTRAVVTAEEHLIMGGLGSAVCELLSENFPCPVERVGIRESYGLSGKPEQLLKHFGLMPSDVAKAVKKVLARKKEAPRPGHA